MTAMRCPDVRELAPDIALGLLTGEERAAALAHLEECDACRAEVASLAVTADELLLAAPEAPPPAGFAERVLARVAVERRGGDELPIVPAPPPAARRRRWLRPAALAAAAALVLVAGIVAVVRPDGGPEPTVASAQMVTGRGDVVGEATVRGDRHATVEVSVPGWQAILERWDATQRTTYWLAVETRDGARTMQVADPDIEEWTVRVEAPAAQVASVSVLDDAGRVWCSGAFET